MKYKSVIGIEIHAQLSTKSKIFCSCSTEFGNEPNTQICPICAGYPGVLPVLNKKVVEYAVKMGLVTNCSIREVSRFARKNYFYPDLPKGYQITQYEEPLCSNGYLIVKDSEGKDKKIGITRIHIEEDSGKSIHAEEWISKEDSFVELNRAGVPLIEIVSEPDMSTPEEAVQYLTKLRQLLRYVGVSHADMEKGHMRCDANVSIMPIDADEFGTPTEIKNLNSFRALERALNYEIERQSEILDNRGKIVRETMAWDVNNQRTLPMRSKEAAHDYRYFPEPDLVYLHVDEKWKNEIKDQIPELPDVKSLRFKKEYQIPDYDIEVLISSQELADYYEETARLSGNFKLASNWIMSEILKILNDEKIDITEVSITPKNLSELIKLIDNKTISGKIAKKVFAKMMETNESPKKIVEKEGLLQITDEDKIREEVKKILNANSEEVERYRNGETKLLGFFVGQLMKATKGKANPKSANKLIREELSK